MPGPEVPENKSVQILSWWSGRAGSLELRRDTLRGVLDVVRLLVLGSDDISHLPFRISYCTADKMHGKVFAYIAQSQHSENLECHAFLCTKRKMVSGERLGLGQALALPWRPCPWGPCLVERQDQGDMSLKI